MFSRMVMPLAVSLALSLVTTVNAENKEIVKYHLAEWKRVHTKNNAEADKLVKSFKTLQVETIVSDHGNHKDLKYRCPTWKQLTVETHEDAVQWEKWLKKMGFKTQHAH